MYKRVAFGSITALYLCSASAYAGDPGVYVGAGFGQASIVADDIGFDGSDSGYKLFLGYSFNPHAAIQLEYLDAGNPTMQRGNTISTTSATGFIASTLIRYPFGKAFDAFGKIGIAFYDTDSSTGVGISYGVGGSYSFLERYEVRAEYEKVAIENGDFSMFSISGVYKF
jgi:OOP family OmpA-OmpF porin